MQFCLAALPADPDLGIVYFLLDDMTADNLLDMMICHRAKLDFKKYTAGVPSREDRARITESTDWLQKNVSPRMLTFDKTNLPADEYGYGLNTARMQNQCINKFIEHTNVKRVMVVIDMFDDMPLPRVMYDDPNYDPPEDHVRQIGAIETNPGPWRLQQVRELSALAGDEWPVVVLAKLRKPLNKNDEPTIADLLGGVDLGYKAKRIIFLVPDAPPNAGSKSAVVPVALCVSKGRFGRCVRLPLSFHYAQFRFEEVHRPAQNAGKQTNKAPVPARKPAKATSQAPATVDPLAGMKP